MRPFRLTYCLAVAALGYHWYGWWAVLLLAAISVDVSYDVTTERRWVR